MATTARQLINKCVNIDELKKIVEKSFELEEKRVIKMDSGEKKVAYIFKDKSWIYFVPGLYFLCGDN